MNNELTINNESTMNSMEELLNTTTLTSGTAIHIMALKFVADEFVFEDFEERTEIVISHLQSIITENEWRTCLIENTIKTLRQLLKMELQTRKELRRLDKH